MTNKKDYQEFMSLTIEQRIQKSIKYASHKNRVPIVIINNNNEFQLKGIKYLIPKNHTVARLNKVIRKNNKLDKDLSFQLKCKKKFLSPQQKMEDVFEKNKSEDGFLYVEILIMQSFGK